MVYTAPAGETAIVKHIAIANAAALSGTVGVELNNAGLINHTVAGGGHAQLVNLFVVLQPGDTIRVRVISGTDLTCWGFGAELEGVAD